jgi:site-specific recombinase XerD
MGAAVDLFCAAKAAEGASPRTLEWYRMILIRAVRQFGEARPVDAVPAAELRAWLLELRASLAPESIAGYVRGLKAFGNWCATEEVAAAGGFRGLRRPKVPHRLIAPFSDPELRSLLALADERERALALVLLDTGLRLSELASLRVGELDMVRRYVSLSEADLVARHRTASPADRLVGARGRRNSAQP